MNASRWVNKLPPEIWLLVLPILPQRALVAASHVCHSWRQRVLEWEFLWTDITFKNTALQYSAYQHGYGDRGGYLGGWAHESGQTPKAPKFDIMLLQKLFALRAGSLPLSLNLELGNLGSRATEVAICELLSDPLFSFRIRTLTISLDGHYPLRVKSIMHAVSAGDASNLSDLILDIEQDLSYGIRDISTSRLLEECLIKSKAPLQRLMITVPMCWTSQQPVFTCLTHPEAACEDVAELSRALRLCPRLAHLSAKVVRECTNHDRDDGERIINLRRMLSALRFLQLSSDSSMGHAQTHHGQR